jgi:hypothetical protein
MRKRPTSVIPSAARDLVFSATYEEEISRLHLEMTVATQSVCGRNILIREILAVGQCATCTKGVYYTWDLNPIFWRCTEN